MEFCFPNRKEGSSSKNWPSSKVTNELTITLHVIEMRMQFVSNYRFSLTDAGVSLALRLLQGNVATSKITPIQRDYSSSDQGSSSSRSKRESVRPKSCVLSKTPSPPSKHYGKLLFVCL